MVPIPESGNIFLIGTYAASDGGTPTLAVQSTGSNVQICSAPGTDIPECHNFWAVPQRLPEIDFVPVKNPSKNLSVPAYRNRVNSKA